MKLKSFPALLALAVVLAAAGCETKEEEPDEEAPPPPTPAEIATAIIQKAGLNNAQPASDMLQVLQQEKNLNSGSIDGKDALAIVARKVDERVRQAEQAENWRALLAYIDAHKVFRPDSKRYERTAERAVIELRKPRIEIKAFVDDAINDQRVVMLEFYLPLENRRVLERMRVGDELHNIKLASIIGNNNGVTLEYLATGESYDVLMRE